jgi:hypothetical protein
MNCIYCEPSTAGHEAHCPLNRNTYPWMPTDTLMNDTPRGWMCPMCHRVWSPSFYGPCSCYSSPSKEWVDTTDGMVELKE